MAGTGGSLPLVPAGALVLVLAAAGVTVVLRDNPYPTSDLFGVLALGGLPGLVLVALGWRLGRTEARAGGT